MRLILINGQPGSGKTAVAKSLMSQLDSSAYIGADSLVATNPWEFSGKFNDLAIKNAISLIRNFSEAGFQNIIISALTRNQEVLDAFLAQLNKKSDILFVWLRADANVRISRKEKRNRDKADKKEEFEHIDKLIPDIQSIQLKNRRALFIDTSAKTIDEVVAEIKKELEK